MEIIISGEDKKLLKQVEELAKSLGLIISKNTTNRNAIENNKIALEALQKLSESGAFKDIEDPVAWQKQVRKDRKIGWNE